MNQNAHEVGETKIVPYGLYSYRKYETILVSVGNERYLIKKLWDTGHHGGSIAVLKNDGSEVWRWWTTKEFEKANALFEKKQFHELVRMAISPKPGETWRKSLAICDRERRRSHEHLRRDI